MPVMPVLAVYLPGNRHELMISEPRYRQLYDDILMTGSRRFMVTSCQDSRLARYGVIFELEDLHEISEDTQDRVKYVGVHSARGRARIVALENPQVWHDQSTYLTAAVEVFEETPDTMPVCSSSRSAGFNGAVEVEEQEDMRVSPLSACLSDIVALQKELDEELRFREVALDASHFWEFCGLWATFAEHQLQVRVRDLHAEVRKRVQDWMQAHPEEMEGLKKDLSALPEEVRDAGAQAREVYAEGALALRSAFQQILQCEHGRQRIEILSGLLEAERRRLLAKKSLKDVFAGKG